MNEQAPDFYMKSSEDYRLNRLRKCYVEKRIHASRRDDYLLIRISPELDGDSFDLPNTSIENIIIATRHNGVSLFPIRKWPVAVYVLHALVEYPAERDKLRDEELKLIGWAELFEKP
jgi:hypothetical protein